MCVNIGNTHQVDRGSQEKRKKEGGREEEERVGGRGGRRERSNSPPKQFPSVSTDSAACLLSHPSWLVFANDAASSEEGRKG